MRYLENSAEKICSRNDIIMRRCHFYYIIFLLIPFISCSSSVRFSGSQTDTTLKIQEYEVQEASTVLEEIEGIASYYGKKFHSRKTSSGEIYDMNEMTASHKSYPFGTIVRVTNLFNGLKTIVKINDRLPLRSKRLIDVSVKAADVLEFIKKGITKVKLEVLKWGDGYIKKADTKISP